MSTILELNQSLRCEVISLGLKGYIWLVTEYGMETSKIFTVILDNGLVYEATNDDVRIQKNYTLGRGNKEEIKNLLQP